MPDTIMDYWKEEADRLNELSAVARANKLLIVPGEPSKPPPLNPDGSLADDADTRTDDGSPEGR